MADNSPVLEINLNEVIKQLHEIALKEACPNKNPEIALANLAFTEKDGSFIGAGEYVIATSARADLSASLPSKSEHLDVLKKYLQAFADLSSVEETDLQAIVMDENGPETTDAEGNSTTHREAGPYDEPFGYSIGYEFNIESKKVPKHKLSDAMKGRTMGLFGNTFKVLGISFKFAGKVLGVAGKTAAGAAKGAFETVLGGTIGDLKSLSFQLGGSKINIGRMVTDPLEKLAAGVFALAKDGITTVGNALKGIAKTINMDNFRNYVLKTPEIDADSIDNDIHEIARKIFPNSDIHITVFRAQELINAISSQNKLTPKAKAEISKTDFSIVFKVDHQDPNYRDYNTDAMANLCNRAFGRYFKFFDGNRIDGDDVLFIPDCSDKYHDKSIYNNPRGDKGHTRANRTIKSSQDFSADLGRLVFEGKDLFRPNGKLFALSEDFLVENMVSGLFTEADETEDTKKTRDRCMTFISRYLADPTYMDFILDQLENDSSFTDREVSKYTSYADKAEFMTALEKLTGKKRSRKKIKPSYVKSFLMSFKTYILEDLMERVQYYVEEYIRNRAIKRDEAMIDSLEGIEQAIIKLSKAKKAATGKDKDTLMKLLKSYKDKIVEIYGKIEDEDFKRGIDLSSLPTMSESDLLALIQKLKDQFSIELKKKKAEAEKLAAAEKSSKEQVDTDLYVVPKGNMIFKNEGKPDKTTKRWDAKEIQTKENK